MLLPLQRPAPARHLSEPDSDPSSQGQRCKTIVLPNDRHVAAAEHNCADFPICRALGRSCAEYMVAARRRQPPWRLALPRARAGEPARRRPPATRTVGALSREPRLTTIRPPPTPRHLDAARRRDLPARAAVRRAVHRRTNATSARLWRPAGGGPDRPLRP